MRTGEEVRDSGFRERGFTYLGLLFAIAIMGATLALTGVVWHTVQQREKERELLFVGQQFRQAIATYYNRSSGGTVKQFPKTLDELLKDPHQLTTQRYLRRIYRDPITGQMEWGLVKTRDDRIMGIFSLSEDAPIKQGNFREADKEFEGKTKYSDWRFVYTPPQPTPQAIPSPPVLAPPVQTSPKLPVVVKPPVLTVPPADSPGDQTSTESLCDTLLKNDASVCQTVVSKYGEESGKICAASAEERFAECRLTQTTTGLPPLQIQFDQ